MKQKTKNGGQVGKRDVRFQELYGLGREAERTLNGYIAYVRKLRAGSDLYGDKFFPVSQDQPAPAEPQPLST